MEEFKSTFLENLGTSEFTITRYIANLLAIELLKQINFDNIDEAVSAKYGEVYNTVWKPYPELIKKFMMDNRQKLKVFVISEYANMVEWLYSEAKMLKSSSFHKLPIDTNTVNSIRSCVDSFIHNNEGSFGAGDVKIAGWNLRSTSAYHSEIEVVEKSLCGIFDNYSSLAHLYNSEPIVDSYGNWRHEILDDKIHICKHSIGALRKEAGAVSDNVIPKLKTHALLLSIIFRSFVPFDMEPDMVHRLYDRHIRKHESAAEAISYGRKFSAISPEAIIGDKLPPKFCFKKIHDPYTRPIRSQFNSLVEQYLSARYLVQID